MTVPAEYRPIFAVFLGSLLYWTLLAVQSSMYIVHDAAGYEHLGRLLVDEGWFAYFKTGPNREPLYPFLISLSMRMADGAGLSYQSIQTVVQILLLSASQMLTWVLLSRLNVRRSIQIGCLIYLGFSPALVNAGLSLFSEILALPCVLLLVLAGIRSWSAAFNAGLSAAVRNGLTMGFLFLAVTGIKAVFQVVAILFLIPYIILFLLSRRKTPYGQKHYCVLFCLVFLCAYLLPLNFYKGLNLKYNGNAVFTDRGAWALYGNTSRRVDAMGWKRILTGISYVPGEGACLMFFSPAECDYWSYKESDTRSFNRSMELSSEHAAPEAQKVLLKESVRLAAGNPVQYGFFMAMESLKMVFWESTKIGFVNYPAWWQTIFHCTVFKNGLRLLMAGLTFWGLCVLLSSVWKKRRTLFHNPDKTEAALLVMVFVIAPFILIHSFFFILTRYAFPIVPLYIALIGMAIEHACRRTKSS